jgi:hypothetical protein
MYEREVENLDPVGALRAALADLPDDLALRDCFDEPLILVVSVDKETGDRCATIR